MTDTFTERVQKISELRGLSESEILEQALDARRNTESIADLVQISFQ